MLGGLQVGGGAPVVADEAGAWTRRSLAAAALCLFVLLVAVGCGDDGNQVVVPTSGGGAAPSVSSDRTTRSSVDAPTTRGDATTEAPTTGDSSAAGTTDAPTTDAPTTKSEATTTRATETTKSETTNAPATTSAPTTTTAQSDGGDDNNAAPWIIAAIAVIAAAVVGALVLRNRSQSAAMKSQQSKTQIDTVGAASDSALELVAFRRSARFDPANAAAASVEVERRAEQVTTLANQAALDESTPATNKPLFAEVAAAGRALTQAELSDRALRVGPPAPTEEQIQYSESITDQRAQQLADATARLRASVAPTTPG